MFHILFLEDSEAKTTKGSDEVVRPLNTTQEAGVFHGNGWWVIHFMQLSFSGTFFNYFGRSYWPFRPS